MITFKELQEGVYDPNIFKSFFLAGGPGSGKSYVVARTTKMFGMRVVNSDDVFEKLVKSTGMNMDMRNYTKAQEKRRDELRDIAKRVTKAREKNYVDGRLGLIIDGTGKNYDKIEKQMRELQQLGYDTHMIFVNTSLETALERNAKRERTVPRSIATKSWKTVQSNMGKFSQYFRQNFVVVDNNDSDEDVMGPVYKQVMSLAKKKVQNRTGLNWIQGELDKRKR